MTDQDGTTRDGQHPRIRSGEERVRGPRSMHFPSTFIMGGAPQNHSQLLLYALNGPWTVHDICTVIVSKVPTENHRGNGQGPQHLPEIFGDQSLVPHEGGRRLP